jgi:hypothetical protein
MKSFLNVKILQKILVLEKTTTEYQNNFSGLRWIVFRIKRPVFYNTLANTFIRTASGDQKATKEEIDAMYRDQTFGTHSSKSVADTSIASINKSSYEQFREYLSHFNPSHSYNRLKKERFGISSGKVGNKWGISGEKVGKSERLILEAVSDNAEITISELSEK